MRWLVLRRGCGRRVRRGRTPRAKSGARTQGELPTDLVISPEADMIPPTLLESAKDVRASAVRVEPNSVEEVSDGD